MTFLFFVDHVYDNVREVLNGVQTLRVHSGGICDSSINALADISRPILWWQCINSSIVLYVFGRYQMEVILMANIYIQNWSLNTLRPRQNGRCFTQDTFKCIFLNENIWICTKISLTFVPKGPINNIPALVHIMAWRRLGDIIWNNDG